MKSIYLAKHSTKCVNVVANPFLFIGNPSLYVIPMICRLHRRHLAKCFFFHKCWDKVTEISQGHMLSYLIPVWYDSGNEENSSERVINNI